MTQNIVKYNEELKCFSALLGHGRKPDALNVFTAAEANETCYASFWKYPNVNPIVIEYPKISLIFDNSHWDRNKFGFLIDWENIWKTAKRDNMFSDQLAS